MTTTEAKKHNGWTNYETWNVALWIGNEQSSYGYWQEAAQECYDDAEGEDSDSTFTKIEQATLDLSKRLQEEIEEQAPDLGASMFSDLLGAALSEVNWHEIAENMIEEVEKEDPDDGDTDLE